MSRNSDRLNRKYLLVTVNLLQAVTVAVVPAVASVPVLYLTPQN